MPLRNSLRIVSPVIRRPFGPLQPSTTTLSISPFTAEITVDSGLPVRNVTPIRRTLQYSPALPVMSTTKRPWILNTVEELVTFTTVPIV